MKSAPSFWYNRKSAKDRFLSESLFPLSLIYGWCVKKRFELYCPVPMVRPVICVGNLVAGGAGKTQVVMSLVKMMKEKGFNPHILIRGYGGSEHGPLQVNPDHDTAEYVGDEALLLVATAPTWVSRNRPLGAQLAIDSGADVVIMDDGFQNPIIYKDFSILVVDGAAGFGNGKMLPAGPLREKIEDGIARSDTVIIVGDDKAGVEKKIKELSEIIPVLQTRIVSCKDNPDIKGKKVAAFAGIGRPSKFKTTLEEQGAEIAVWKEFPDHHPYSDREIKDIILLAKNMDAPLFTTAKDYVRVPLSLREHVQKYEVKIEWKNSGDQAVIEMIKKSLGRS